MSSSNLTYHAAGQLVGLRTVGRSVGIPKVIHQTFPTQSLPARLAKNVSDLRSRNPDYVHRLYTDSDIEGFILREYGRDVFEVFSWINPTYGAARADLFRYLLMYRYGGIYLDIKSSADRPFDEVLRAEDEFIISQWNNAPGQQSEGWGMHTECKDIPGGEFQQWHIICSPGHPFLAAVVKQVIVNINSYRPWQAGVGWLATLRTTGPIAYTKAIQPLLGQHPHRRIRTHHELSLRYSIYENRTAHRELTKTHYKLNQGSVVLGGTSRKIIFGLYLRTLRLASLIYRKLKALTL